MNPEQKAINERWTKGSDNYDRIIHDELSSFRVEGWRQLIAAQTGSRPGLKVLDCGCGPAFFTIILAKAGYHVTGVDAVEGMLQKKPGRMWPSTALTRRSWRWTVTS